MILGGLGAEAIETGRRLLGFDSLQEDVHRALMRLYAAERQRGLALEQYQACRRLLAEDLGLRPDEETENLLREIRRQPARGAPAAEDGWCACPGRVRAPCLPSRFR